MHPDEKIRREVAVMRLVKEKTKIPLPKVIAFGTAADNHDPSIGPFLITEWVEGITVTSLIEELPRPSWGPVLRHDVEDNLLRKIYGQMANILLELSEHDFYKIGALSMTEEKHELSSWSIDRRPMTMKMNDVEAGSNVIVDGMTALESSFPYANMRRSHASSF
jgi:aminoglycoside phosphotransferase (APT) family kinase protein